MPAGNDPVREMPSVEWEGMEPLLERFDAAWQRGERPTLDDFLPGDPAIRSAALVELVHTELERRLKAGEAARVETYFARYPELTADRARAWAFISAEYDLRQRTEPGLSIQEYERRFPDFRPEINAKARTTKPKADTGLRPRQPATQSDVVLDSVSALAATLRSYQLLERAALEALPRLETQTSDVATLARELTRRGWLTVYQVERVLAGQAADLVLGTYVLLERLGQGGMGTVYKARHRMMNRVVAVKVIRKELLAHPGAVQRFEREIEAAAKLSHPNIVIAHDAAQVDDRHFFAMEYVDGIDLLQLLRRRGPLPVAEACDYARQTALGLQHASEQGLVHRDIKPANLLLSQRDGVVKVLDMGLARLHQAVGEGEASMAMTQEGTVMGTPDYIAPEQALNSHTVDVRADIYSLGCTLYHLLAGTVPFPGGTLAQKIAAHLHQEPPALETRRANLPRYLALLVKKMMAKNPADRYRTPLEVARALEHCIGLVGGLPPTPAPVAPRQPPDREAEQSAVATVDVPPHTVVPSPVPVSPVLAPAAAPQLAIASAPTVVGPVAPLACPPAPVPAAIPVAVAPAGIAAPVQAHLPAQLVVPSPVSPVIAEPVVSAPVAQLVASPPPAIPMTVAPRRKMHRLVPLGAGLLLGTALALLLIFKPWKKPAPVADPPIEIMPDARLPWYPKQLVAVLGEDRGRHWGPVRCAAFSADGKRLVTGGDDGVIRIWDAPKLREKLRIMPRDEKGEAWGHARPVKAVALSPDGKWLASVGEGDGPIRQWDLAKLKVERRLPGTEAAIDLRFSQDSSLLIFSGNGVGYRSFQTRDGLPGSFNPDAGVNLTKTAMLSADNRWQASCHDVPPAGTPTEIRIKDLTKDETRSFAGPVGSTTRISFSAATKRAITSSVDGTTRLWDTSSGKEVRRLVELPREKDKDGKFLPAPVARFVAFSSDGQRALVCLPDGPVKVWAAVDGRDVGSFTPHGTISGLCVSPTDQQVVTFSSDCTARLWDMNTCKEVHPLSGHHNAVTAVAITPDARRVLTGGNDDTVRMWELKGGREVQQEIHRYEPHTNGLMYVAFLTDESRIASTDGAYRWREWEIATGKIRHTFETASPQTPAVILPPVLSPDSQRFLLGTSNSFLEYKVATGSRMTGGAHLDQVRAFTYSSDGKRVFSGGKDNFLRLWDEDPSGGTSAYREARLFPGHTASVVAIHLGADGKSAMSFAMDRKIGSWDLTRSDPKKMVEVEGALPPEVSHVGFSPDGKLLACTGLNGQVLLWDVSTGKKRNDWPMPGPVYRLAWCTDSRHLVTANANGTAYVYRLDRTD